MPGITDPGLHEANRIAMQSYTDKQNREEFERRYHRINELETAINRAVSQLRHHHISRGGISVIADELEKAAKKGG